MLSSSKITKEEMAQNPDAVIKVLEFYNASQGDQKTLENIKSGNLLKSESASINNLVKDINLSPSELDFTAEKAGDTPTNNVPKVVLSF